MGVTQTLGCIFASLWSVTILHLETLTLALSPLANPLKLARSPCKREVSQLYMEIVADHLKYHNFTWKQSLLSTQSSKCGMSSDGDKTRVIKA